MKKLFAITLSVLLLVSAFSVYTFAKSAAEEASLETMFAQDGKQELDKHPVLRRILQRIASRLDLTDVQKEQVREILEAERPIVQPIIQDTIATRHLILEETKKGNFDEARVRDLATRQGVNLSKLIVERERVKTQIYHVLTPEQRAKVAEMKDRFEQKIRERIMQGL